MLSTNIFSLTNIYSLFNNCLKEKYKEYIKNEPISKEEWIERILEGVVNINDSKYSNSKESLIKQFSNRTSSASVELRKALVGYLLDKDHSSIDCNNVKKLKGNIAGYYDEVFSTVANEYIKQKKRTDKNKGVQVDYDENIIIENIKTDVLDCFFNDVFRANIDAGRELLEFLSNENELDYYEKLTWIIIIGFFDNRTTEQIENEKKSKKRKKDSTALENASLFSRIVKLRLQDTVPMYIQKENSIIVSLGINSSLFDYEFHEFCQKEGSELSDIFAKDKLDKNDLLEYTVLYSEYMFNEKKIMDEAEKSAKAGIGLAYSEYINISVKNILFIMRLHNTLMDALWRQKKIKEHTEQLEKADKLYKSIPFLKEFSPLTKEEITIELEKQYFEHIDPSIYYLKKKALYYSRIGIISKAMELYSNELHILWTQDDKYSSVKEEKARLINNSASIFRRKRQYGLMHQYYDYSFDYRNGSNNEGMIATGYVGRSIAYRRIWELDKARADLLVSGKIREDLDKKDRLWLSLLLNNKLYLAIVDLFDAALSYGDNNMEYKQKLDSINEQVKDIQQMINDKENHAKDDNLYTKQAAVFSLSFYITLLESSNNCIDYSKAEIMCEKCFETIKKSYNEEWKKQGFYFDIYNEAAKAKIAAAFCCYMGKEDGYETKAAVYFNEAKEYIDILKENDVSHDPESYSISDLEAIYLIEHGRFLLDCRKNDDAKKEFETAYELGEKLCVPDIETEKYKYDNMKAFKPIKDVAKYYMEKCIDPMTVNEVFEYTDRFLFETYLVNTAL